MEIATEKPPEKLITCSDSNTLAGDLVTYNDTADLEWDLKYTREAGFVKGQVYTVSKVKDWMFATTLSFVELGNAAGFNAKLFSPTSEVSKVMKDISKEDPNDVFVARKV